MVHKGNNSVERGERNRTGLIRYQRKHGDIRSLHKRNVNARVVMHCTELLILIG